MNISEFTRLVNEIKEHKPILFGLENDKAASDNEIEQIYGNKCGEHMCIFNHEEKQVIEETEDNFFQALVKYGLRL